MASVVETVVAEMEGVPRAVERLEEGTKAEA